MNSMSRPHDCDDRACGCKKEKEKEAEVLLKCKVSNAISVTATDTSTTSPIASITLNTNKFCLPCTKFEFANNLVYTPGLVPLTSLTITYQLQKLCRGETVPTTVGNPWVFSPATATLIGSSSNIFGFIVCECDCDCDCIKDDCCVYTVNATYVTTPLLGTATLAFNNPTLSALVVDKKIRCCD